MLFFNFKNSYHESERLSRRQQPIFPDSYSLSLGSQRAKVSLYRLPFDALKVLIHKCCPSTEDLKTYIYMNSY